MDIALDPRVRIGGRWIGDGEPCFVIAEAGSNHNGSLEQAKGLIDAAADAGVDCVKFQVFRASRLYVRSAGQSDYLNLPKPIYDIIADMEMPYEWLPVLAEHARERQIMFLASVCDEESADRLDPFVGAFKIASYEITHAPLIRHVAAKGKPVIVSTGATTMEEVAEAVDDFRATGNRQLLLMQCTASYPAPLDTLNVRAIPSMKAAFGVPVGFSDHSREPLVAPLAAVSLGANALEKHFTYSNRLPGPDHRFALEPDELAALVRTVRETERTLGNGEKTLHGAEGELRSFARRSVFAMRDIAAGEAFTRDNVAVLRCGKAAPGLQPKTYPELLHRRAARAIRADAAIQPHDVHA